MLEQIAISFKKDNDNNNNFKMAISTMLIYLSVIKNTLKLID
jgi:hypothetical protein